MYVTDLSVSPYLLTSGHWAAAVSVGPSTLKLSKVASAHLAVCSDQLYNKLQALNKVSSIYTKI